MHDPGKGLSVYQNFSPMERCISGAKAASDWELSLEQWGSDEHRALTQQDVLQQVQEEVMLALGWSNCTVSVLSLTDEHQQHAELKAG